MFAVKFRIIAGLLLICICDVVLGKSITGSRREHRSLGNATIPNGLESMLNTLNGTANITIGNISSFKGESNTQNTSTFKTINVTEHTDNSTFNKTYSAKTVIPTNNLTSNTTTLSTGEATSGLNTTNSALPFNNYTLHGNSTFTAADKDLLNVTNYSNNSSANATKSSSAVSKSEINLSNETTALSNISGNTTSLMASENITDHSNSLNSNASNVINGTVPSINGTLDGNDTSNAESRSLLNAFLINAINEKTASNPSTDMNNANTTTTTSNAGTRSDMKNGIENYSKNNSISNNSNNKTITETKDNSDLSNETSPSNSSSSTVGIIDSSSPGLIASAYSNTSTFTKDNATVVETKKYISYDVDNTNTTSSQDPNMANIVQLINNLTDSNWTAYPLSMTSSGETISSLANLINSLNALNWTDHSNTSSDDSNITTSNTSMNLFSAADKNDTLLEHSKNVGNLNDTLILRLKEYLQAMNLTADANASRIYVNDSVRERLKGYLDALNTTGYTNKTIANTSKSILESAKKFPTISNLLEKGKGILEKSLGVTIDDKQVAELVSHFINWRDQSNAHPCLRDILNAREVNECFAKLAGCEDDDKDNATKRNVLSNLRHFLTCKKKQRNGILVGNYTVKTQREDSKNNDTREESSNDNDKLHQKGEVESQDKQLEKWMFDESDCDDSINALEKCQFEKMKEANKSHTADCEEEAKVLERCKLNGKSRLMLKNKTDDCDDSSDQTSESCKFKMGLSKFMNDTCERFTESYRKCKPHKEKRSEASNGTCEEESKALENCRSKAMQVYERDCGDSSNQTSRCFIMNHLSSTTFSGNIEKADVVNGEKTIEGARNETVLNVTTDFESGNDTFRMKNLTHFKECEGCLKNNNTGIGNNYLNFNTEKGTSKSNATDDKKSLGEFLKKFEIKKMSSKCYQPSIFEMWKSQDDDDQNTVKDECFSVNKRNNVLTKHTTSHNKQTASDGTVMKDKTTEGTKVTDDEGRDINKDKTSEGKKVTHTEGQQVDQTGNNDDHSAEHKQILEDILSGKHENDNNNIVPEKVIETDENRTIPIDPSMLNQGQQKEHDFNNPDADVGIVGIDRSPPIDDKETKNDESKSSSKGNDSEEENEKKGEENESNEEKGDKNDAKSKDKEDKSYWLGGESDDKGKKSGKKNEDKRKRILCFGDSITKGYYDHGKKYHPYSIKLEALLREDNIKVEVINHGVNGECISLEMEKRLAKDLEEIPDLDLVIILGGTNDLLNLDCVRKLDLFQEIKNLHILVRAKGYKSVVVTIPEAKMNNEGTDKMTVIEYRKELDDTNQKLRMYSVAAKLPIIDLADDFSRHTLPGKTNVSAMWDDDIHPSREGYDRIGEIIYDQVKGLL